MGGSCVIVQKMHASATNLGNGTSPAAKGHQNHVQACKTSLKPIIGTPSPPKVHPSDHKGCPMRLQMASRGPTGEPKGAQKRSKGTLGATQMKENDPRGAKRGPRKNTKAKLQYYLVNNTIQEAKLQYSAVNNTIRKSVFYGFS